MISMPLLKRTTKSQVKMWGVLTAVLSLMLVVVLVATTSFQNNGEMMWQQFYTMFASLIPLIYISSTANKLIAQQVDNGSMAYVMSNPIKRNTVSMTQAFFLIASVVAMYGILTIIGVVSMLFIGEVIVQKTFLLLNLGSMLLNLALSGIAYCASCFFNTSRTALAIGAGIPVAFFLLRMLSDFSAVSEGMEALRYLTLNTLFNLGDIIAGSSNMIWQFAILFGVALVGYAAGIIKFRRKDLPL